MQAQQKFTQPPTYGVTFPEGEKPRVSLYNRDSLTLACRGNERMASVLDYFLYEGSWEIDRQKLPEGCKVVEFTRKHGQILKRLTFSLSRKSLIGYLDIFNTWGFVNSEKFHNRYTVHFDTVQTAIDNPPAPKERKPRTRKGCKVEAITTEDNTSTLLQKVEELQRNVEELQPYVEEVQRLRCNITTLQRDFSALVEALQGQSSEEHILLYYPLLSSLYQESAFANTHAPLTPSDFLPEEIDEDDRPTERLKVVKPDTNNLSTPVAIASIPGEAAAPPAALTRQSQTTSKSRVASSAVAVMPEGHEQQDGAATDVDGGPRASGSTPSQRLATAEASDSTTALSPGSSAKLAANGKEVTQAIQKPLSLKEDEPVIRPETPAQRKRRIEQREKEIWALVEAGLRTKFTRTHRQLKANTAGMERLIEDETDNETIKEGLEKLSDFWKNQFDLAMFHAKLPGLVRKQPRQKPKGRLADESPQNVLDAQYEAALEKTGQYDDGRHSDFDEYVGNGPEARRQLVEQGRLLKAQGFCPDL